MPRPAAPALALAASLLIVWTAGGCAALVDERDEPFGVRYELPDDALHDEPIGAVLFFVDGVSPAVFDEMLAAGRLPNLKRHLVDRGFYARRCVANVPSVTLANETSFVTGLFPGRHAVTGINWFDRNRLIWRNYETIAQKNALAGDYLAPTVYERLPDRTTFSVFFQAHRGATKFVENWTSAGPPYFFGMYHLVDRIALLRFNIVADVANRRGRFPAVVIAYQLAPDFAAYRHGVGSETYREALEHTDAQVGRVLRDFEASGILDKLILGLISDHGMAAVERHWPVEPVLRSELGLAVARKHLWEKTPFEKRLDYYRRFSAVVYGSGDRYAAVCLRKPRPGAEGGPETAFEPWTVRPSPGDLRAYPTRNGRRVDLIETFRRAEAVDAVAWRAGADRVRVATKRGIVELSRPSPESRAVALTTVEGGDPLGYRGTLPHEMLDGRPVEARTWLEATGGTAYPDLPPQLLAYFDAPRAGDLVLFAAPGWDFGTKWQSGHGGLGPDEMFVPLALAGPGVPHGEIDRPVRAVDVAPTVLDLLGRPVPTGIDGISLRGEWRRERDADELVPTVEALP